MAFPHNARKLHYGIYKTPKEQKEELKEKEVEEKINADLEALASDEDKDKEKPAEEKPPEEKPKEGDDNEEDTNKKKKKQKKRDSAKISCEYNLYLQDDTNADSALFQWYYFSVMNIRQDTFVRINICNLSKPNTLYSKGMKPFVYSMNKFKQHGIGWRRGGENITYF